jgi:Ca-activated chloride channel family protein
MPAPRIALAAVFAFSGPLLAQVAPGLEDAGLYFTTAASAVVPATRLTTEFDIEVSGIVARVSVRQRFRNDGSEWVEGVYVFPLPDDAAVDRLTMEIGDRRIEGEIFEREQARQTYERARAAGQQASLVEQERPNLFTTSVANIAPGQEIVIEIGYLQTASFDAGRFELRVPMTLTPRFTPGGVPDAPRIVSPVRSARGNATHGATVEIAIDAGMPLAEAASSSHELTANTNGTRARLTTGSRSVPMDRDLVVGWQIVADQTPRVAAFTETVGSETFTLLMFMPPATTALPETTPREVVFVIDTSGSMEGNSIARARTALQSALGRLTSADRFNVIEFNNEARALYETPVALGPQTLEDARRFVSRLEANGGTNIASALAAALGQQRATGFLRQIVFITDGSVGNEPALFEMIRRDLGDARLFTVGIGTAPNTHFMRKAAQFGRGSYSHIARAEEVEPGMDRLFTKLEHVALTDIEIDWPESVEVYPERIPDLYRGEPVVVAARAGALDRKLSVEASGRIASYSWNERVDIAPGDAGGIASIWARRKIESLLDRRLDGAGEDTIRPAVIDVALAYGMLSPYTSLVAVDLTPEMTRTARLRREALGSLPPAGAAGARFANFPATATNAELYQLIGTLLTAILIGLGGIARLTARRDA